MIFYCRTNWKSNTNKTSSRFRN